MKISGSDCGASRTSLYCDLGVLKSDNWSLGSVYTMKESVRIVVVGDGMCLLDVSPPLWGVLVPGM